jgi:hypothetical protein
MSLSEYALTKIHPSVSEIAFPSRSERHRVRLEAQSACATVAVAKGFTLIGSIRRECLDHVILTRQEILAPVPFGVCRVLPSVAHPFSTSQGRSRTTKYTGRQSIDASPKYERWEACTTIKNAALREHSRHRSRGLRGLLDTIFVGGCQHSRYHRRKCISSRYDSLERGDLWFQRTAHDRYTPRGRSSK